MCECHFASIYADLNQFYRDSFRRYKMKCATLLFVVVSSISLIKSTTIFTNNDLDPLRSPLSFSGFPYSEEIGFRRRCPVCDSSVFSYCSDKLFHDSCCCHNPNNPYDRLPYQCQFADCSFLHANTCQEHKLITACCCTNAIFKK